MMVSAFSAGFEGEEIPRGLCRENHFSCGTAAHTLGISVTPHIGGEGGLMPFIDAIADGLADQVV